MAQMSTIHCTSCGKSKEVNYSSGSPPPSICSDCKEAEEAAKKEKHLTELSALPIEERLAKIEKWMYKHRKVPHGYQYPPVF